MKSIIYKETRLKDIILIASLPDMGKVGGLVSSYLAKELDTKLVASIEIKDKPWVIYKDGIARIDNDVYNIYADETNSIVVFYGDTQPQEGSNVFRLCNELIEIVKRFGNIKMIYTAGGYLRDKVVEPKVYGAVNNPLLLKTLERFGILTIGGEISTITWFNGLILGIAAEHNIDAIGLFGEIDNPHIEQPLTAKNIIKIMIRMINDEINLRKLI
ncbi:MAG: PAC2 family protein [Candidatus Nitrosocaldaceae archaeon]